MKQRPQYREGKLVGRWTENGIEYRVTGRGEDESLVGTEIRPEGTKEAPRTILIPTDVFLNGRRR